MDLLKISLLSPLIYLLVSGLKGFAVALFLVLWMLDVSVPHLTSMEVPLFLHSVHFWQRTVSGAGCCPNQGPDPERNG